MVRHSYQHHTRVPIIDVNGKKKRLSRVEKFEKEARKYKDRTVSKWSHWRYEDVFNRGKEYTFTEMKRHIKSNPDINYIAVNFKGTYFNSIYLDR